MGSRKYNVQGFVKLRNQLNTFTDGIKVWNIFNMNGLTKHEVTLTEWMIYNYEITQYTALMV